MHRVLFQRADPHLVNGCNVAVLDALLVHELVELLVIVAKLVDKLLRDDVLGGERDAM